MTALVPILALLAAANGSAEREPFNGVLVPANATDLFAPEAGFKIRGSTNYWGQVTITELTPDGTQVKAGDVVVKFDFTTNAKWAFEDIENRRQQTAADAETSKLGGSQRLEQLRIAQRRRQLEAQLTAITVQKERSVSRKQAAMDKINHRIADFETEAAAHSLAAATRAVAAEASFQRAAVAQPQEDLDRIKVYEKRYQVHAPHDGVVRHALNSGQRRSVQKGDNLGPGVKVVSVAKDSTVGVRFFVPEQHIAAVTKGAEVSIVSAVGASTELRGAVTSIEYFPQEIGFLMENANLSNGREKAFAVTAELRDAPGKLTAGNEVRVKVLSP